MNESSSSASNSKTWPKHLLWLLIGLSIGLSIGQMQVRTERESTSAYMKIGTEMSELLSQCMKDKSK